MVYRDGAVRYIREDRRGGDLAAGVSAHVPVQHPVARVVCGAWRAQEGQQAPWLIAREAIHHGQLEAVGAVGLGVTVDGVIAKAHQTARHVESAKEGNARVVLETMRREGSKKMERRTVDVIPLLLH